MLNRPRQAPPHRGNGGRFARHGAGKMKFMFHSSFLFFLSCFYLSSERPGREGCRRSRLCLCQPDAIWQRPTPNALVHAIVHVTQARPVVCPSRLSNVNTARSHVNYAYSKHAIAAVHTSQTRVKIEIFKISNFGLFESVEAGWVLRTFGIHI